MGATIHITKLTHRLNFLLYTAVQVCKCVCVWVREEEVEALLTTWPLAVPTPVSFSK